MTEELYTAVKNDFIAAPAMPAPIALHLVFRGRIFASLALRKACASDCRSQVGITIRIDGDKSPAYKQCDKRGR
jgi:hypothetical protein